MAKGRAIVPKIHGKRLSGAERGLILASALLLLALSLLTARVFAAEESLQIAALWSIGGALLSAWLAVLLWRIPVLSGRTVAWFGGVWAAGIGISVWLVVLTARLDEPLIWDRSVDWLALTLSLASGGLFLRALLRRRTSPLPARLLSLLSPLAILLLIILLPAR